MERGCMQRNSRKEGLDVWQFRWSETRLDGKRFYHKKIVGTVEQYPDEDAARRSVVGLVSEVNADGRPTNSGVLTVAQLCDHFEQRELSKDNIWRSHATKKIYQAYLSRWIRPHWQQPNRKRSSNPPSQGAEPVLKCGYGSSDERSHGKTTDAGRDSADCGGVCNERHATE